MQMSFATEAGSILVIWDYTRLGEDSRKFILLPGALDRASGPSSETGELAVDGTEIRGKSEAAWAKLFASLLLQGLGIWNFRMFQDGS